MPKKKSGPTKKTTRKSSQKISIDNLQDFSLRFIRLVESSTSLLINNDKIPTNATIKMECGHMVAPQRQEFIVSVVTKVAIEVTADQEEKSESRLKINVGFECQFAIARKPTQDEAVAISRAGSMATWPHIREFVSQLTAKMGQPTLTLPLLHIDPKSNGVVFTK